MADHADDAIMVTPDGPAVGKEAVRGMYEYYCFSSLADLFARLEKQRGSRSTESGLQEAG
jgi:hypothetical protein